MRTIDVVPAPAKQLSRVLRLPARMPLHVSRLELDLHYKRAALRDGVPAERAREMKCVTEPLTQLLRAGFLCRPAAPDPTALVTVEHGAADHVTFTYAGRGVHANLLVALVRMIYAYHQSPPGMFASMVASLGEAGAREACYEFKFGTLVATISAGQLVGLPEVATVPTPGGMAAIDEDMPLPATGAFDEPILDAELVRVTPGMGVPEELEDAWLSCSQVPLFVPPGHDAEFEPGEEDFAVSKGKRALEIAELSIEPPFLFELLDMLSGGQLERRRVVVA